MGINDGLILKASDLTITKQSEGCRLTAYQDSVGVWTIGWGHTGPEVHEGLVWTQAQADAQLLKDMAAAEANVRAVVEIPLTQDEFIALCDLAFNIGTSNLDGSTLLRLLNAGDIDGAIAQFSVWNEAGGRVLAGLVNRRTAEATLFKLGANCSISHTS
jgi:lysozyme